MADRGDAKRPLSDRLLEAAARIEELPLEDAARLLMKAAIRLRVVQQTGAPEAAARRVLAEIHATFTEGFDYRDLEGAREILDAG